jgi:4-amino-4-deoxy-L-arabinose transferase-like glycosyltransferase
MVVAVLLIALTIRVAFIDTTSYRPINDGGFYLNLASQIAHTGDYSTSHSIHYGAGETHGPSAYFAPGYPYFLAAVDTVTGHRSARGAAVQSARVSQAVLGTATVGLLALVALEAFGSTVAWIALLLGAVYPVLVEDSGVLLAENLMSPLLLVAVWAGLRARDAAQPMRWVALAGLFTGLATLAHENAALLLLPLGIGLRHLGHRRLAVPGLVVLVAALTIAPWTIRNAVLLHRLIPVSDETGITLVGTYNHASAHDPRVPYKWRLFSKIPGERRLIKQAHRMPEPELSDKLQSQALRYISHHPFAPLAVSFHNTLRMLELEGTFAWKASFAAVGLKTSTARVAVVAFYCVALLALLGAFTAPARAAPRWLWAVPLLMALSVVLINVETPRFREPVDVFIVMLASCGTRELALRTAAVARRPRIRPYASRA